MGKCPDCEVLPVEEFVDGEIVKYLKNDGIPCEKQWLTILFSSTHVIPTVNI